MDPNALHHQVHVRDDTVVKIRKNRDETPAQIKLNHECVRSRFPHLPNFLGVTELEGKHGAIVERADPIPITQVKEFLSCFLYIVGEAGKLGIVLDPKPSNFGKTKDGKNVYLDESGVGDNIMIPDVVDSFTRIFKRGN